MKTTSAKPKIYVESSTISYLTARPSEEPIRKAKQIITKTWWAQKDRYELFISEVVINEIGLGDPVAAELRLEMTEGLPLLAPDERVDRLSRALLDSGAIPPKSEADADHVAYAAVYGMDVLLTWNQKHIATNARRSFIDHIMIGFGYKPPQLLTPEQHLLIEEANREGY